MTRPGESVLKTLGDAELWKAFREIGIKGMHTGPMKLAGGIRGREYTPTIDGNFDRISSDIDPAFGTEDEYKALTKTARLKRRHRHWRHHPRAQWQGRRLPARGARLPRLPGPLLGVDPSATRSAAGLPRARALYGSLDEQLKAPTSFASRLKKLLRVREAHRIYESERLDVPAAKAPGLLVMVHRLPGGSGIAVTALNFARTSVREAVAIEAAAAGSNVIDLLGEAPQAKLGGKRLALELGPHEGKILLVK